MKYTWYYLTEKRCIVALIFIWFSEEYASKYLICCPLWPMYTSIVSPWKCLHCKSKIKLLVQY
jgi:hypothetical protein